MAKSSRKTDKGILKVRSPYLRIPYCLLQSKDFLLLEPMSVKIFMLILSKWKTNEPDEPVEISITEIQKRLKTDRGLPRRNNIVKAITQLITFGFISKELQYKKSNQYHVEHKRFTGEYE